MKKWIMALLASSLVLGLAACNNDSEDTAIVESKAGDITKDELYQEMKDKYGETVLQQLVYEKVLADKYKVTDEEVQVRVDELKSQLGDSFEMALSQYGYANEKDLKNAFKLGMLQEKAALETVNATDAETKKYYDEQYKPDIKASHILVADEKTAKEVKKKLDEGAKFEDLAKEYSTDTASAEKDGDLDWFGPGVMDSVFEEAAYKLDKNQISEPVKTENGFHIIKVTDKKEKEAFDKVKDDMAYEVKLAKLDNEKVQAAVQKVLDKANVKVKDKDLKDIFKTPETPETPAQ